jgi:hypothetical protein
MPRIHHARAIAALTAGPLAVLAAGSLVWSASDAAFTASTRNSGNAWSTGSVVLTDDDNGNAAFTVNSLVPGQTGTKCIVVSSNSTVAGQVRAYMKNLTDSAQNLSEHIKLTIEQGTGGTFNDCTGFTPSGTSLAPLDVKTLAATASDYSSGTSIWNTTGTPGEKRTYRGTWSFDTTGMTQQEIDRLQGATLSVDMVWELQSN